MPAKSRTAVAVAALLLGTLGLPAPTRAEEGGVKAGFLTCNVSQGWGFVFGSSRDLKCIYQPGPGSIEHYTGQIKKFGVDVGYQAAGVMVWGVIAPTTDVGKGALAGDYAGGTAGASVVGGVGANALFGGLNKSIALQPVSLEGTTGLNVAAGIAQVELTYQPQ